MCACVCLSVCVYIYIYIYIYMYFYHIFRLIFYNNDRCWLAWIHIPPKFQRETWKKGFVTKHTLSLFSKKLWIHEQVQIQHPNHNLSPNTSIVTKNLIVQRFVHFVLFLIKLHEQLLTFLPNFRQATAKDGIVFVYILCLSIVIRSY